MKQLLLRLFFILFSLSISLNVVWAQKQENKVMKGLADLNNRRIGVLLGSIHDVYAHKHFPSATILQFNTISDMLYAVNSEKVDVVFVGKIALNLILKKNKDLGVLVPDIFYVPIAAGFNSSNDALRLQFNAFLSDLRTKGIYKDMVNRWVSREYTVMPDIPAKETNGILRVGLVSDIGLPFIIIQDRRLVGFDIELGRRFAAYIGMKYEPVDLQFGSLIASITTHKIDIITSSMAATAERAKQIDFSDPYYQSGATLIAKKKNIQGFSDAQSGSADAPPQGFFQGLKESFYNNIIHEKRYLIILDGLFITLIVSLFSVFFGTLIGIVICMMRMSEKSWLSAFARMYITLIRGIPVLVLLMIICYVVFASVNVNPIIISILAFGMNFGAYAAEIFRSGIISIDKGQKESALACGFNSFQSFRYIILPQALRPILPIYKGEFISLIKMTSIVGYIAVQDLTKASDIIRSRTFDAFFPLIMVAIFYFTLAWVLTMGLDYLTNKLSAR